MDEPSTPLMRQYAAIKKDHPSALLFFRLGDFYELFFDDAVKASKELQITLTSRNKEKGIAVPMCGVPYHAAEGYIGKLIRKGYKVAICEQTEDPKIAKKLVRREVTRVVTPGTADPPIEMPNEQRNELWPVELSHRQFGDLRSIRVHVLQAAHRPRLAFFRGVQCLSRCLVHRNVWLSTNDLSSVRVAPDPLSEY